MAGAVRVFRSQLPRDNAFYPDEPAERGGLLQELSDEQQTAYDARGDRQGLTLVHFSAQLEPFLAQNTP